MSVLNSNHDEDEKNTNFLTKVIEPLKNYYYISKNKFKNKFLYYFDDIVSTSTISTFQNNNNLIYFNKTLLQETNDSFLVVK